MNNKTWVELFIILDNLMLIIMVKWGAINVWQAYCREFLDLLSDWSKSISFVSHNQLQTTFKGCTRLTGVKECKVKVLAIICNFHLSTSRNPHKCMLFATWLPSNKHAHRVLANVIVIFFIQFGFAFFKLKVGLYTYLVFWCALKTQ